MCIFDVNAPRQTEHDNTKTNPVDHLPLVTKKEQRNAVHNLYNDSHTGMRFFVCQRGFFLQWLLLERELRCTHAEPYTCDVSRPHRFEMLQIPIFTHIHAPISPSIWFTTMK